MNTAALQQSKFLLWQAAEPSGLSCRFKKTIVVKKLAQLLSWIPSDCLVRYFRLLLSFCKYG